MEISLRQTLNGRSNHHPFNARVAEDKKIRILKHNYQCKLNMTSCLSVYDGDSDTVINEIFTVAKTKSSIKFVGAHKEIMSV